MVFSSSTYVLQKGGGNLKFKVVFHVGKLEEKSRAPHYEDNDFPADSFCHLPRRVARWFIFIPKITVWVNFWRALESKMLAYFMNIMKKYLPLCYACLFSH
jgi:hypothetical protein